MATTHVYGTTGSGKSIASWRYTIKLPECLLCKKQGRFGVQGETFNPQLGARLPLCKKHWATWRTHVFQLPLKKRGKIVKKLKSRLAESTYDQFKALFSMFWDLLQMSAETKELRFVESFFEMKKAA